MHNLEKPTLVYKTHYKNCIMVRNVDLAENLDGIFPLLKEAAARYDVAAKDAELYTMKAIDSSEYSPVTTLDLKKLYTQQMVVKGRPARNGYDKILIAAKGRCPFCSHNLPTTLDHYLAKTEFPEFSVLPINLVPCCKDCNHSKLAANAEVADEQFIHPYYDDISQPQWLEANLVLSDTGNPTISFYINESAPQLAEEIYKRLDYQFTELTLNTLYSIQAGNELTSIDYNLRKIFAAGGVEQVKQYLQDELISRSQPNKNSWQAAMYRCISVNDEFCNMNWSL